MVTADDPHLATVVVTSFDTVLSNDTFDLSDISHAIMRKQTLACFFMSNMLNESITRTVDTDVVVIAIYCFHNLGINRFWIEFEIGDKTRFIAIHEIVSSLPQTLCASLPFFHAFTGCDTVSSFFGLVKKRHGIVGCSIFSDFVTYFQV